FLATASRSHSGGEGDTKGDRSLTKTSVHHEFPPSRSSPSPIGYLFFRFLEAGPLSTCSSTVSTPKTRDEFGRSPCAAVVDRGRCTSRQGRSAAARCFLSHRHLNRDRCPPHRQTDRFRPCCVDFLATLAGARSRLRFRRLTPVIRGASENPELDLCRLPV